MLEDLKYKLYSLKRVIGAELVILADGSYNIRFTELSIKNDIIQSSKGRTDLTSVNQLKNSIDDNVPVVLVLTGKGIIQKRIEILSSENEAKLQQVFPNASYQDFYLESFESTANHEFVSVIRKEQVDKIINEFATEKISLIGVHLGPFIINSILSHLTVGTGELIFDKNQFSLKDSQLISYQKQDSSENITAKTNVLLKGSTISEQLLISYAAAFEILTNPDYQGIDNEQLQFNFNELLEKTKFKVNGWAALLFFLLILLINFFAFSHYNAKKQLLNNGNLTITAKELDKLTEQVKTKEVLIKDQGGDFPYKYAYLADHIGSTVPSSVQLDELTINPFDERRSKEQKRKILEQGTIVIKGTANDIQPVNNWVLKLQELTFIKDATVVSFVFNDHEQKGVFELNITLKQ